MQHFDMESTVFEREEFLLHISIKKSFFTFLIFFIFWPISPFLYPTTWYLFIWTHTYFWDAKFKFATIFHVKLIVKLGKNTCIIRIGTIC